MFSTWYKKFFSQPHQPFFVSGIILFIIFLFLLASSYANIIALNDSIAYIHEYPMIHLILVQFFLGFLFVVFPKFLLQANIAKQTYMNIFFIYMLGSLTYLASMFAGEKVTKIAIILLLIGGIASFRTLLQIHQKSIVTDKHDTTWLLVAFFFGILSNFLFFISTFHFSFSYELQRFSINLGFFLFVFAIVWTVSQRMVPFFTSGKVQNYQINKSKYILEITFVLIGLKTISLSLNYPLFSVIINFALFTFFAYELLRWKLPIFKTTAIMWVLYLGLFWVPIGFFMYFIESISSLLNLGIVFEQSPLHAIAVGYFVTMLIGFGTRVTLGHSGKTPTADKVTIMMFWLIQIIVLIRIFAGITPNMGLDYTFWIALSAFLLALAIFAWSCKYLLILIKGV